MKIKQIFDEITSVGGDLAKKEILKKYSDNELLRKVLYLCLSKRIKFFIKQIPEYKTSDSGQYETLEWAIGGLDYITSRKYTGKEASNWLSVLLSSVDADDAFIIERIIDKDPKIGMGVTFINEVLGKLIEETPYMGAISFNEVKARKLFENGDGAYSQIKMDGRYANATIVNNEVYLESRQGEPTIITGAKLLEDLSKFSDVVLNGELTMDSVSRYESNGIISSIIDISSKRDSRTQKENDKKMDAFTKKHGDFQEALDKIRFTVWDGISVVNHNEGFSDVEYNMRLTMISDLISQYTDEDSMVSLIDTVEVTSFEDAMEHFKDLLNSGEEGTVLKSKTGFWKDGKPNWQIKLKLEMNLDLKIVGFNFGTKGTKNENVVSSLNVESSCGLLKTRPQGLNEKTMVSITENMDNLLGTIIEVKCSGLSNDSNGNYSLLYPAFKKYRDDKSVANSLEECIEIQNSALGLTKK